MNHLQNGVIDDMNNFFQHIEQTSSFSDATVDSLTEDLKKYFSISTKANVKKEKKKIVRKLLEPEQKCLALKADGTQCGGKRFDNEEDPEICPLHKRNGVKHGKV